MANAYPTDLKLHIDGERLGAAGRAAHRVVNPATGETLGELPLATVSDLDRALDTAARGYRLWRGRGGAPRRPAPARARPPPAARRHRHHPAAHPHPEQTPRHDRSPASVVT